MWPGINTIENFALVVSLSVVSSALVQNTFKRLGDVDVISGHVTIETNVVSPVACATTCVECGVFVYDETSMECRTYGQLNTTLAPSVSLTAPRVWLNKDMHVIPAQTSSGAPVSLEDAVQLCLSIGGRLAKSQPDFYNAYLAGLHLCTCGMLDGGIVRLSVQVDDGNCPTASSFPSMPTCKPGGVYMSPTPIAYCAFN